MRENGTERRGVRASAPRHGRDGHGTSPVAQDPLSGPAALQADGGMGAAHRKSPMRARRKSVPRRKGRAGKAARLESEPCVTFCSVAGAVGPFR
jgi:hypothetical protein